MNDAHERMIIGVDPRRNDAPRQHVAQQHRLGVASIRRRGTLCSRGSGIQDGIHVAV